MDILKAKVERAKHLIKELDIQFNLFAKDSVIVDFRYDQTLGKNTYYVKEIKDTPNELKCIVGDVIQNLRSSLDHVAYRLFILRGYSDNEARQVYFPIKDDERQLMQCIKKTKWIDETLFSVFSSIKAFRDGNNTLWQIHNLNNRDKHRLLITTTARYRGLDVITDLRNRSPIFKSLDMTFPPHFIESIDQEVSVKVGDILFTVDPGEKPQEQMLRFELTFNEKNVIEGVNLFRALDFMIKETENVIDKFSQHL